MTCFINPCRINIVGVNDAEGTPVPISNTVVKLGRAEDTWSATTRENRKTPTFLFLFFIFKKTLDFLFFGFYNVFVSVFES